MTTIQTATKLVRPTKTSRRIKCPKLTTADLRNDAKMLQWIAAIQTAPINVYDAKLFDIFAAAECALDHGDNPPALFAWIVNGRRWHMLTNEQDDRAQQRLRRLRNPEREAERNRRQNDVAEERHEAVSLGEMLQEVKEKLFGISGVHKTNLRSRGGK